MIYNPGKHIKRKKSERMEVFHHRRGAVRVSVKFQDYMNRIRIIQFHFLLFLPHESLHCLELPLAHGGYKHLGGTHTAEIAQNFLLQRPVLSACCSLTVCHFLSISFDWKRSCFEEQNDGKHILPAVPNGLSGRAAGCVWLFSFFPPSISGYRFQGLILNLAVVPSQC